MTILMIAITLMAVMCQDITQKRISAYGNYFSHVMIMHSSAAIISLIVCIAEGMSLHLSTILFGFFYSCCGIVSGFCCIQAMRRSMASKVSFVKSCSFLIPSFYSLIVYHESFSPFKILGIILVCCAQISFCIQKDAQPASSSKHWLTFALACMFTAGLTGILQKEIAFSAYPNEVSGLSFSSACFSLLFTTILHFCTHEESTHQFFAVHPRNSIYACLMGLFVSVINIVSTKVSHVVDGSIIFPVFSCGGLILTILAAHIVFKERLTKAQFLSIALGLAAICIIGL